MSERLVVDSIMTADGEVVPLGPVDKDGHRVPFDTTDLYGPRGEHYKVKSFLRFPLMDGWFMECAFTHDLIDVSSLRLKAPDSWEKLLEDLSTPFAIWSASPWNWLTLLKTINTAVHAATFIRTTKIITVTTVSGAPPAAIPSRIVRTIG